MAREVIPHEARVRAWLGRSRVSREDIDDVIQDAYCRLAMLDSVGAYRAPGRLFLLRRRHLLVRQLERQQVVSIEAIADIESLHAGVIGSNKRRMRERVGEVRVSRLSAF